MKVGLNPYKFENKQQVVTDPADQFLQQHNKVDWG